MNLWKVILAALVLYLVGIGTGFFVASSRAKNRPALSERPRVSMHDIMQRMESRLELNDDQKEKVSAILQARQKQMRSLMDEVRPQIKAAEKTMREKIEALLSEEQRAKFEEVFSRRGMKTRRSPRSSMRGNDRREQGIHKRREETEENDQPQNSDSDCPSAEGEEIPESPIPSKND